MCVLALVSTPAEPLSGNIITLFILPICLFVSLRLSTQGWVQYHTVHLATICFCFPMSVEPWVGTVSHCLSCYSICPFLHVSRAMSGNSITLFILLLCLSVSPRQLSHEWEQFHTVSSCYSVCPFLHVSRAMSGNSITLFHPATLSVRFSTSVEPWVGTVSHCFILLLCLSVSPRQSSHEWEQFHTVHPAICPFLLVSSEC
jgi:hypothetical protein